MRVLLVAPWSRGRGRFRSPLSFLISNPPLTLPMLAALVPKELNATISVFDEISGGRPPAGPFDVVAITVLTAESGRAYELADHYRSTGARVVLGGYHVTFMPDEALAHADAIVTGPAIDAWPALLRDIAAGRQAQRVYRDDDASTRQVPMPDRSVVTSRSYAPLVSMMASNGCPFDCAFCAIRSMGRYTHRPVDDVVAELRAVRRRSIMFCDPNFFASRNYALALMRAMKPLRLRWGATASIEFAFDEELMKAAHDAGCIGVLIGFESLNPATLRDVNKQRNDPDCYRQAVGNVHRHHMTVNGTFVLGLDGDTKLDLLRLPDRVRDIGVDLPIYFILAPAPGGPLFAQLDAEGRILTKDWSRYNQAEVVVQPKNMTPDELMTLFRRAWRRTYSVANVLRRVRDAPSASPTQRLVVLAMNIGFKFLGQDKP